MPPKKKTKTQKKDQNQHLVNDAVHVDDDNKSSLKGKIAGKCRQVVIRHSSRVIHYYFSTVYLARTGKGVLYHHR